MCLMGCDIPGGLAGLGGWVALRALRTFNRCLSIDRSDLWRVQMLTDIYISIDQTSGEYHFFVPRGCG